MKLVSSLGSEGAGKLNAPLHSVRTSSGHPSDQLSVISDPNRESTHTEIPNQVGDDDGVVGEDDGDVGEDDGDVGEDDRDVDEDDRDVDEDDRDVDEDDGIVGEDDETST